MLPPKALIGMIHTGPLPAAPLPGPGLQALIERAAAEARILADAGFDGVIVENMHDRPYVNAPHGPEVTACMTLIVSAVREAIDAVRAGMVLGVQVLSAGEREAMAVALACGGQFIRCENFVYAHVADEGLMTTAAAGHLLRYRRVIGADQGGARVAVMCDVKKKHASHAMTADVSLGDAARAAEFFSADGVIVTGAFTGHAAELADIREVRAAVRVRVWVGSGVTAQNAVPCFDAGADALIVGSAIKRDGLWSNGVDSARCRELVSAVRAARG